MTGGIAIIIESFAGGGAQHVAATLANAWAQQQRAVTAISFAEAHDDVFRLDPSIQRIAIGGQRNSSSFAGAMIANIRRLRRLRSAIRASQADTVLAFIGTTNILTILATRGLSVRTIVAERNDPARQSLGRFWNPMRRWLYRRADLVVANSRAALESMTNYVPRTRLAWLPNPLRVAPNDDVTKFSAPTILAVGRLHHQKGFDDLLRSFALYAADHPQWRLLVLGEGAERTALEHLADELGIGHAVTMPGFAANPFAYYKAARFLVHPARYEGLPNAVLEAMSVGLPAIVTRTQLGILEYLTDGVSGLVVPVDDPAALAAAMKRLADDEALHRRLSESAIRAIEPCQPEIAVAAWTAAVFGEGAAT
jgi:glycosyltransferase involved in cell wall biosynthesis